MYWSSLQEVPPEKMRVERNHSVSAVMVRGTTSEKGKFLLLFVEIGLKINKKYSLNHDQKAHLIPTTKKIFGKDHHCIQQV